MEKIPAACAMDWSIQLEKGLRSKKPGKSVEEILKVGQRLKWWNRKPIVGMVEYQVFDLIPGEDKLFANAILLRLVDIFRLGTKEIKTCVVKVFLEELKSRRKRDASSKNGGGSILDKLDNKLELLKKVKIVFDNGDVEERALALILFGCWANFAKDSADIRCSVLSCLTSSHIREVKASLFAAGCFSEMADDFAFVLLEMFFNFLISSQTPLAFKLAVGRAFSNLSSSFSVANEAYMAGLKLVMDSSEEQFTNVMLVSLTKVTSKWSLLVSRQVDLLFQLLAEDRALCIRSTALKCLRFTLAGRLCSCPATTDRIQNLFHILRESPALHYEAVKVLHKIIEHSIPSFPTSGIGEVVSMVLAWTEITIQSPIMSNRLLAFRSIVDVSGHLLGKAKDSTIACQVISVIIDRICVLINSKQLDAKIEQEVTTLLKLLLNLVERQMEVSSFVLDKFCAFVVYLGNILYQNSSISKEGTVNNESFNFGRENLIKVLLKSSLYLSKVMIACVEKTESVDGVTSQVLNSLKLLVENMHKPLLFDSYTFRSYLLLLQSDSIYSYMSRVMKQGNSGITTSPLCGDSFPDHEFLSLRCAKKISESRAYWSSYRAAKYAACQGSWSTAAFIFEQLSSKVQSDSCSWWLKCLTLLSRAESQIQFLGLHLSKDRLCGEGIAWKFNSSNHAESVMGLQNTLRVAKEMLVSSISGVDFTFQKWVLALRVKALEAVLDITRLLSTASSIQDSSNNLVYSSRQISYQLTKIAHEFDFLTSFIGMDKKSAMIISAFAMSCSLLAFSTTFALSIPSYASQNMGNGGADSSGNQFYVELIQDLLGWLWCLDSESSESLQMLLKAYQNPSRCFSMECWSQAAEISCEKRIIVKLCRHSVLEIVGMQNEARQLCNAGSITRISGDGLQLLLNIISKWMQIPFRCPKNFFQVKAFISSELFAMSENGENVDRKSVPSGSDLQLNLCLQLKNVPPSLPFRLSKLYCILSCTMLAPSGEIKNQFSSNKEDQRIDDILELNVKLLRYVTGSAKTPNILINDIGNRWTQDNYVCFHSNDRGQGFSSCLLDISAFPAGVYQMKWHSCCIDSEGSYWSILPQNSGPIFSIVKS